MSNESVVESRLITFEEGRTSKDAEISQAGLSLVTEFIRCNRNSIWISDIFGRACVDNVNSISMGMVEEGSTQAGCVE